MQIKWFWKNAYSYYFNRFLKIWNFNKLWISAYFQLQLNDKRVVGWVTSIWIWLSFAKQFLVTLLTKIKIFVLWSFFFGDYLPICQKLNCQLYRSMTCQNNYSQCGFVPFLGTKRVWCQNGVLFEHTFHQHWAQKGWC